MRMLLTWLLVLTVKADPFYRDQRPRPGLQFRSRKFVMGKIGCIWILVITICWFGVCWSYCSLIKRFSKKKTKWKGYFHQPKRVVKFSPSTHGGDSTFSPQTGWLAATISMPFILETVWLWWMAVASLGRRPAISPSSEQTSMESVWSPGWVSQHMPHAQDISWPSNLIQHVAM